LTIITVKVYKGQLFDVSEHEQSLSRLNKVV